MTCVLNITLKNGDVCAKYLYEMTDTEAVAYFRLVHDLFDTKKKST